MMEHVERLDPVVVFLKACMFTISQEQVWAHSSIDILLQWDLYSKPL